MSSWSVGPSAGSLPTAHLIRLCDYAIAKLIGLGVECGPNSRLSKARATLLTHSTRSKLGQDAVVVAEAVRTAIEFHFIARAFGGLTIDAQPVLRRLLDQSLTGALDPRLETNPIARNSQFELSVGAFLSAGGFPIAIAEPDLIARIGEEEVGVAAKRVTSRKKIVSRVKAAVKQIERTGRRGIVALNVDSFVADALHGVDADVAGASFASQLPELALTHEILAKNMSIRGLLVRGTKVTPQETKGTGINRSESLIDVTTFDIFRIYAAEGTDLTSTGHVLDQFKQTQKERLNPIFRAN